MTTSDVDRIRAAYHALARGDIQPLIEVMDEDIERIEPDAAPGVGGVHRGREATLTEVFGRLPDIWDDFAVIPATFIDGGEHVVVLGELSARDPGSGRAVRAPFAHVWRMADGRAVWWRCYEDTALLQGARAG